MSLVVPNTAGPLVVRGFGGNLVLLGQRLINHGFKIRVNLAGHDLGKSFAIGLVNLARFAGGLQPVDDQLDAQVGGLERRLHSVSLWAIRHSFFCSSGLARPLFNWLKGTFVTLPK